MRVSRQVDILNRVFDALDGVEVLTETEAASVIANLAQCLSGEAPGRGIAILAKSVLGIAQVEGMMIPTAMAGWVPVASLSEVPSDGTYVDLWVRRGDGGVQDCYFPKCYFAEGEWVTEDGETTIGHADFFRIVTEPQVFAGSGK